MYLQQVKKYMNPNQEQLAKLARVFNSDKIVTTEDIAEVLKGVLNIVKSYKESNEKLNKDTESYVDKLLEQVYTEHEKIVDKVSDQTDETRSILQEKLSEIQDIVSNIQMMKPRDGVDGKDADEDYIIEEVLSKIKLPEYKEPLLDTGEDIVAKINSLELFPELQIDASHIKNLPEGGRGGVIGPRNIKNMLQAGSNVTLTGSGSVTDPYIVSSTGGGSSIDLEVNGTPNVDQTLLNLVEGNNMTIVDNGDGSVTFNASGGGSGSPGGSDTQLQYNNAGSFGGITGATTNGTVMTLTSPVINTSLNANYSTASRIAIFDSSKNLISADTATYPSLTELSYIKGATSSIQTQLGTKAPTTSPTFATSITGSYLTASEILITDGSKNIVSASVSTYPSLTELSYVKGVTSSIQTQINALANGMIYKGNWDASAGTFPGSGSAQIGWFYTVSVAGTVDSVSFEVGDRLIAITNNASTTTYAGNWTKLDATDAVTSVFGRTGNVVATSGDYTASQITNIPAGNISATTVQAALNELDTEKQATGNYITALTGDATASGPGSASLTLATVNSNVGSFGSSTSIPSFTVNAKGLITAASGNAVIAPAGTLTGTTLNATVISSSLTSVGTLSTGTWNASVIDGQYGGTGVANTGKTITLGGNLTTSGANNVTFTTSGATNVTLPTTGTLATLAGSESLTNKSVNGVTLVSGGTSTKYLSEDGTYTTPAGGGDVSKVGTPVNNQMAVWTGDGTLEGTSDLTYDGTNLNLITGKNFQIAGTTILTDLSGTTTLSGIDAIDSTTESTIEAAMDTLPNVNSIQGYPFVLSSPGVNAFFGWDNTANGYEILTATEATAILNNFVGDSGSGGTKGLVPAPAAGDAAAGKFLKADGTWATSSGAPGGSDTYVQVNESGSFGGYNTFRFDYGGTGRVTAENTALTSFSNSHFQLGSGSTAITNSIGSTRSDVTYLRSGVTFNGSNTLSLASGLYNTVSYTGTGASSTIFGIRNEATTSTAISGITGMDISGYSSHSTGTVGNIKGVSLIASNTAGGGTVTTMQGGSFEAYTSGTVTTATAGNFSVTTGGNGTTHSAGMFTVTKNSGTVTTLNGANISISSTGTTTDVNGIKVGYTNVGTTGDVYLFKGSDITFTSGSVNNIYGFYMGDISGGGAASYSMYLADASSPTYIAGEVTIGAYTLPNTDGTSGYVLTTNGSGVVSWQAGGGGVPTQITVANEASDTSCFLGFFTAATGDLGPKTNTNLTFNSSTGVLTLGQTAVGSVSGNAGTATALQNARTIGGVSFDGTANITVASATGGFTVSGGDLAIGANNLTITGSIGSTGSRSTKGWFTDLEVTNAIAGSITGNAATVTVANEASDTTCFLNFTTAASGSLAPKTNTNMTFNSSTGVATFASTVLTTTDINGGTIDGAVIGSSSAAAITGTTVTATTLVVGGDIQIDGTPNTDDTWSGPSTNSFNAGATIAQWEAVYLDSSSTWQLTDADAVATAAGMIALATAAGSAGNPLRVTLPGSFVRNDSWNWTVGGTVYLSTTAGGLTQTAPTGSDDVQRVCGWAVNADTIFWNPSPDYAVYL